MPWPGSLPSQRSVLGAQHYGRYLTQADKKSNHCLLGISTLRMLHQHANIAAGGQAKVPTHLFIYPSPPASCCSYLHSLLCALKPAGSSAFETGSSAIASYFSHTWETDPYMTCKTSEMEQEPSPQLRLYGTVFQLYGLMFQLYGSFSAPCIGWADLPFHHALRKGIVIIAANNHDHYFVIMDIHTRETDSKRIMCIQSGKMDPNHDPCASKELWLELQWTIHE